MTIPQDKLTHFILSVFIVILFSWLSESIPVGILTALILGMAKEAHDLLGFGTAEIGDVVANVLGILVGYLTIFFFKIVS